ncbi:MAG: SRPBCC family protein [Methylococcales bacterium]|nr:SRPBCC family protein [Methylococcales bacterium]
MVIEQPVDTVYAYVAEQFFRYYPEWTPEVVSFAPINRNPMKVGAMAKQVRIDQGQKVESVFEVTVMLKNQRLELTGLSAPYRNTYLFARLSDHSCRLTFKFEIMQVEIFMRPFEKLIRRAIEEGAEATVTNIKNLLNHQVHDESVDTGAGAAFPAV